MGSHISSTLPPISALTCRRTFITIPCIDDWKGQLRKGEELPVKEGKKKEKGMPHKFPLGVTHPAAGFRRQHPIPPLVTKSGWRRRKDQPELLPTWNMEVHLATTVSENWVVDQTTSPRSAIRQRRRRQGKTSAGGMSFWNKKEAEGMMIVSLIFLLPCICSGCDVIYYRNQQV